MIKKKNYGDYCPETKTLIIDMYESNCEINNMPFPVTKLFFRDDDFIFNHPVDNLPNTITHISFGYVFNQPVDNLPNSITHLTFKLCFNQPVNNLPNSITHLTFDHYIN
jgi:hypothetical protein